MRLRVRGRRQAVRELRGRRANIATPYRCVALCVWAESSRRARPRPCAHRTARGSHLRSDRLPLGRRLTRRETRRVVRTGRRRIGRGRRRRLGRGRHVAQAGSRLLDRARWIGCVDDGPRHGGGGHFRTHRRRGRRCPLRRWARRPLARRRRQAEAATPHRPIGVLRSQRCRVRHGSRQQLRLALAGAVVAAAVPCGEAQHRRVLLLAAAVVVAVVVVAVAVDEGAAAVAALLDALEAAPAEEAARSGHGARHADHTAQQQHPQQQPRHWRLGAR
eukprot:171560-Prymnesium_polylepis.1